MSEYGEGRFNAFGGLEPEDELASLIARLQAGRDPPIYLGRQAADELSSDRYPRESIDLTPFSQKEKMMRLLECIQARMIRCEYYDDPAATKGCLERGSMRRAWSLWQATYVLMKRWHKKLCNSKPWKCRGDPELAELPRGVQEVAR